MVALAVFAGALAVFGTAARLTPDPTGIGTHRQLGTPSCLMPMLTGYPCPTCGMTTSFALAVRGRIVSAFHAQPAGLLIAIALTAAGVVSLVVFTTGLVWRVNWDRIPPGWLAVGSLGILLAGWLYKIIVIGDTLRIGEGIRG